MKENKKKVNENQNQNEEEEFEGFQSSDLRFTSPNYRHC
jgi:hypothetical protein